MAFHKVNYILLCRLAVEFYICRNKTQILKATIKGQEINLHFDSKKKVLTKNNQQIEADIKNISESSLSILLQNKSYRAELLEANYTEKQFKIRVNGNVYQVALKDKYDELLQQLGMDIMFAQEVNDLKAPMPGLVLDILVSEGQTIQKGDNLLVLEAMKMENNLKATNDAVVKKIKVSKGDKVEKNTVLIELS